MPLKSRIINWICKIGLKKLGEKLSGKKLLIAGIFAILEGVLGAIRIMFPDLTATVPVEAEGVLRKFTYGFGLIGGAHKVQKVASNYKETKSVKVSVKRALEVNPHRHRPPRGPACSPS